MPIESHSKLLTGAAREVLRPLGLRQKGRSRTWIDDRGWWLGVVEFQPSSWSKGTHLNVGGMWLWDEQRSHLAFDVGHRVQGVGFVEYVSDEQFSPEAERLATLAAEQVAQLRLTLRDLDAAVAWLRGHSANGRGWPSYHLGIALGLSGQEAAAIQNLRALDCNPDDSSWWHETVHRAHGFADLLARDAPAFRAEIQTQIASCRAALKLEPADGPITLS